MTIDVLLGRRKEKWTHDWGDYGSPLEMGTKTNILLKKSFCFYKNSSFHISSFSNMIVVSTVCFAYISDFVIVVYKILINFSIFENTNFSSLV